MIDVPDAPWIRNYDHFRNQYYGITEVDMSVSKWAYSPEKCDGDFCPGDCDLCSKAEEEEEDAEL